MAGHGCVRDRSKEQFWRRVIGRQRGADVSVWEFCRRESLKESAFYFWRRELARREAEPASGRKAQRRGASLVERTVRRRPLFLPIGINSAVFPSEGDPAGTIEVRLPQGITLRIGSGVDATVLAAVRE